MKSYAVLISFNLQSSETEETLVKFYTNEVLSVNGTQHKAYAVKVDAICCDPPCDDRIKSAKVIHEGFSK